MAGQSDSALGEHNLKGRVALVTGASKGIGRAVSMRLAEMGVKVAVNYYTSKESAKEVVRIIQDGGGEALVLHADVSKRDQVVEMVDRTEGTWGDHRHTGQQRGHY